MQINKTIKAQKMESGSTFSSQFETDIKKYNKQSKKKFNYYQQIKERKPFITKNINNSLKTQSPSVMNKKIPSINQIRRKYTQQKSKEMKIKGEIQYLVVQKERKNQSSKQVRDKYQKVLSIRSQSLKDKNVIKEELIHFQKAYYNHKKSKVLQVQSDKLFGEKSQKKLFNEKLDIAKSVRLASKMNQSTIQNERSFSLAQNKKNAEQLYLAEQQGSQLLKKLAYQKIQIGKRNHQKKIWDQYKKLQLQSKTNQIMIKKFSGHAEQLQEETEKAERDLSIYRSYLRLTKNNPERSSNKKNKLQANRIQDSKYLYITF